MCLWGGWFAFVGWLVLLVGWVVSDLVVTGLCLWVGWFVYLFVSWLVRGFVVAGM